MSSVRSGAIRESATTVTARVDAAGRILTLGPGLGGGASYAVVKVGSFALDLRLDLVVGGAVAFGSAGVGVNLN